MRKNNYTLAMLERATNLLEDMTKDVQETAENHGITVSPQLASQLALMSSIIALSVMIEDKE